MSHFYTLVLIPNNDDDVVADMLKVFDENKTTEEYRSSCYCVGSQARTDASKAAEAAHPIDRLREAFREQHPALDIFSEEANVVWDALLQPHHAIQAQVLAEHPMSGKPSPECDQCQGTGLYPSNYNPLSKWDWWVEGGRWSGVLPGGRNEMPVAELLKTENDEWVPRALVLPRSPDSKLPPLRHAGEFPGDESSAVATKLWEEHPESGKWVQRGEMGWWGTSTGDEPKEAWRKRVRETLSKFPEHLAVVVDCHI